jgi:DNA modification methylase
MATEGSMSSRLITENTLFYGDNLIILREHIPSESVDLVYLDPSFNSNRSYKGLRLLAHEDSSYEWMDLDNYWVAKVRLPYNVATVGLQYPLLVEETDREHGQN